MSIVLNKDYVLPEGGLVYNKNKILGCVTWQNQDVAEAWLTPQLAITNISVTEDDVRFSIEYRWIHNAFQNSLVIECGYYYFDTETNTMKVEQNPVFDDERDKMYMIPTEEGSYDNLVDYTWKQSRTLIIPREQSESLSVIPFFKLGGRDFAQSDRPSWIWNDYYGALRIYTNQNSSNPVEARNGKIYQENGYKSDFTFQGDTITAVRVVAGDENGINNNVEYAFIIPAKTQPTTPTLNIKWSENNYYPDNLNWTYGADQIGQDNRVAPVKYNLYVASNENMLDKQTIWSENQNITNINSNDSYVPDFINMEPGQQLWYQIVVFDENGSMSYSNIKGPIFTSPTVPTDQEISDSGMSPKSGYSKGGTIAEGSVPTTSGDEDAGFGWMACLNSPSNEKKLMFEIKKNTTLDRIIVVPYNYIRQNNVTARAFNEDAFYILPDIYIPWINISYTF